jgi:hypothetical protein
VNDALERWRLWRTLAADTMERHRVTNDTCTGVASLKSIRKHANVFYELASNCREQQQKQPAWRAKSRIRHAFASTRGNRLVQDVDAPPETVSKQRTIKSPAAPAAAAVFVASSICATRARHDPNAL